MTIATESADSPSDCENRSTFPLLPEAAGIRTNPCPSVPIQLLPSLSRTTVWTP